MITCKHCWHADNKHENHCPVVNGKWAEWEAGYGAAKEGDNECEPVVETGEDGRLVPCSDLTYGLGWAIGVIEAMEKKHCSGA
jgi:hypothetical protein